MPPRQPLPATVTKLTPTAVTRPARPTRSRTSDTQVPAAGDQNMVEHAEGANTVGTSGPPQWALDLQCACEELTRVQGRELEDDQWALKAALERIYGGLEQAPPVQAFPVPDVVLLPMQTASVRNYVSGTQEFQPTASAVSAAARGSLPGTEGQARAKSHGERAPRARGLAPRRPGKPA